MPDITMCSGSGCSDKNDCYRHKATPTPKRQSYFNAPPGKDKTCVHYWPTLSSLKKRNKVNPTDKS